MANLADMLKKRVQQLGFEDIKECARQLELPYELFRKVISDGHIPKDKTLLFYADKLGLDSSDLISTAYREKAPETVQHLFERRPMIPKPSASQRLVPVLGQAACGPWLESASGDPEGFEPVDIADPQAFFVVAEGESMVGAHIPPGAHLLVSPSAPVHNGAIVLAGRNHSEYTVKTLHRHGSTTILQPMNPAFQPLVVEAGEPLSLLRITEIRIKV
ncbi:MAG: hypothetical protein OEV94_07880 [Deltaproteobacteria bacterium]|nr:hypothetical protein [Deltaproteobacteria bacterium]